MFNQPGLIKIFLICCFAVLYCQAKLENTNNIASIEEDKAQHPSLVGAVDLVYCFFDTSSISVISSSEAQQEKYRDEFESGRYVESFTRHRTLSYLRYFLRGVSKNMPWIRNLIVVTPEYDRVSPIIANNPAVTVVKFKDFVPKEYLPVFNEEIVLLFMHLIPNISREFIYMNQHMYPIAPLTPQHFKSDPLAQTLVPIRVQREGPSLQPHEISAIDTGVALAVQGPSSNPAHVTGLDYDHLAPLLIDTQVMQRIHDEYQQHVTDAAYNKFPSPNDVAFKHLYVHYLIKKDLQSSSKRQHELVPSTTLHLSNWTDRVSLAKLRANNITVLHVSHELLRAPWKNEAKDPLNQLLNSLYSQVRSPYEADLQYIEARGLFLGLALIGLFVSCTLGITFHFELCRGPRRVHGAKIA